MYKLETIRGKLCITFEDDVIAICPSDSTFIQDKFKKLLDSQTKAASKPIAGRNKKV